MGYIECRSASCLSPVLPPLRACFIRTTGRAQAHRLRSAGRRQGRRGRACAQGADRAARRLCLFRRRSPPGLCAAGDRRARIRRVVLLGRCTACAVRGLALPDADALPRRWAKCPIDPAGHGGACAAHAAGGDERRRPCAGTFAGSAAALPAAVLDDFTLVPLAVGDATPEEVAEVLEALWGGDETLIVISSDLSHYLPYAGRSAGRRRDGAGHPGAEPARSTTSRPAARRRSTACCWPPGATICSPRLLDAVQFRRHRRRPERVVGYAAFAFQDAAGGRAVRRRDDDESARYCSARAGRHRAGARPGRQPRSTRGMPGCRRPGATFVTLTPGRRVARLHRHAGSAPPAGRGRAGQCGRRGASRSALCAAEPRNSTPSRSRCRCCRRRSRWASPARRTRWRSCARSRRRGVRIWPPPQHVPAAGLGTVARPGRVHGASQAQGRAVGRFLGRRVRLSRYTVASGP